MTNFMKDSISSKGTNHGPSVSKVKIHGQCNDREDHSDPGVEPGRGVSVA